MNRSISFFTFLVAFFSFNSCQVESNYSEKVSPNVLLIMTDDQGWGDLSIHGNDSISTPNLDALAKRSVRFDRFYVSPVCAPTRASLLTGRYHLRTGTSWVTHRKEVMQEDELTMAEILKSAGYKTGIFGKWHNGLQYPHDPIGQGFDEFFGFAAGHWNNYFNTTLTQNDTIIKTEGFITDVLTDQAIKFIEDKSENRGQNPFFCYLPYNAPHSPFQVPDVYFDKYKKLGLSDKNASVYGMVENIDDNIGRILKVLEDQSILENTIVIFLTDNGPNGIRYNGDMRGTKGKVHEGGVRVPLFVSWKNHLPENKTIHEITAHIDLLPTLIDLCNLSSPEGVEFDGRSLADLMMKEDIDWEQRNIYTIHSEGEKRMFPSAVRTNQYRMIIDRDEVPQLYDMVADPSQKTDISGKFPELVASLNSDLEQWFQDVTLASFDPPLIEIGHSESPTTLLPAPEAQLEGGVEFQGGWGWANDYSIKWKKKGDAIKWEVDVVKDGAYEFFIHYDCSEEFLGAEFEIQVGTQIESFSISEVGENDFLESPDRVKRGEVYEKVWSKISVGRFELEKGLTDVILRMDSDHDEGWMEVERIETHRKNSS